MHAPFFSQCSISAGAESRSVTSLQAHKYAPGCASAKSCAHAVPTHFAARPFDLPLCVEGRVIIVPAGRMIVVVTPIAS